MNEEKNEQKSIFQYLSSGKADIYFSAEVWRTAASAGLNSMQDLQNFVALYRPGPLMFLDAYIKRVPCALPQAAEIAAPTHNVLLYIDQLEEALQLLSGCTPEEAVAFCKENTGSKLHPASRDDLLSRIARQQGVSPEEAEKIYSQWRTYAAYPGIRRSQAEKIAQGIYSDAQKHLKTK